VFASDYAGLKKDDRALNQRMVASEGRFKSARAEIIQLLKADPRHGRVIQQGVEIDATLVNEAIAEWKA
jgi:NitT/TauT family transport system substrate-binding protein